MMLIVLAICLAILTWVMTVGKFISFGVVAGFVAVWVFILCACYWLCIVPGRYVLENANKEFIDLEKQEVLRND
jgi:hypothetical protein